MCVLTYIPTPNNGYILTSNRDEAVSREPAIPPKKYIIYGHSVFLPKDPQGGGTWIGGSKNFTLCLLNGGFKKHIANPPYRQSRGKIILDFYYYLNVESFVNQYDFNGIEPFTLIIIEKHNKLKLSELRLDGNTIFHSELPADQFRIWSSVTLYSPDIIQLRERWFLEFINTEISPESILKFHHFGGKGDIRNTIKMNRDDTLKTISITQFVVNDDEFTIRYEDLQAERVYDYRVFKECV